MATEELKVILGKLGLGPGKRHFILAGLCVSTSDKKKKTKMSYQCLQSQPKNEIE